MRKEISNNADKEFDNCEKADIEYGNDMICVSKIAVTLCWKRMPGSFARSIVVSLNATREDTSE